MSEEFTPEQRERLIQAAITTQALSGFILPREVAQRAFDAAMLEPLPSIGEQASVFARAQVGLGECEGYGNDTSTGTPPLRAQ